MAAPTALVSFALRRRRALQILSLVGCAAGAVALGRLAGRLDTDTLTLLPRGLPALDAMRESMDRFGTSDRLYVIATPAAGGSDDDAVALLEDVAARIPEDLCTDVQVTVDLAAVYRKALLPRLPLLLPPDRIDTLAQRLEPRAMADAMALARRRLSLGLTARERGLVAMDPLGLGTLLPQGPAPREIGLTLDPSTGAMRLHDGSYLLVATPRAPASDIPFGLRLRDAVAQAVTAAEADAGGRARGSWGGAFQIALWDFETMTGDLRLNLISSVVAVALIFVLGFRGLRSLPIALAPLAVGIMVTFLAVDLLGMRLTSATLGFGAMLVGLGIDFSIVLLGRSLALEAGGSDRADALHVIYGGTLRGVTVGAATTAGAFLALLASAFPGLRQLGLLTAAGTMACLGAVVLLLPGLVVALAPRPRPLWGFGFSRLPGLAIARPRLTLALAFAFTALCAAAIPSLRLEDDMRKLRAPDNPGVRFEEQMARRLGRAGDAVIALVKASSPDALEAAVTRAHAPLAALEEEGLLAGSSSPRDFVPDPADQEARLAHLRRLQREGHLQAASFSAEFDAAATAAGWNLRMLRGYRQAVLDALAIDRSLRLGDLSGIAGLGLLAPDRLREGADQAVQIVLHPAPGVTPEQVRRALAARIEDGPGSITITGFVFVAQELRQQIRREAVRLVPLGTALVVGLLWVDLRSARKVVLAVIPIGLGLVWMLGIMSLTGIPFNFFNTFVLALVQGIGVDYGVHVLHRVTADGLSPSHLQDVGAAVTLAALTTVAGFGSLALCNYPALASMGLVTTLGTMGSLLAALTVLPALCSLLGPHTRSSSRQE